MLGDRPGAQRLEDLQGRALRSFIAVEQGERALIGCAEIRPQRSRGLPLPRKQQAIRFR